MENKIKNYNLVYAPLMGIIISRRISDGTPPPPLPNYRLHEYFGFSSKNKTENIFPKIYLNTN